MHLSLGNLETPAIIFLHELSGICSQCEICSCVFSPVTSQKIIIITFFYFWASHVFVSCNFNKGNYYNQSYIFRFLINSDMHAITGPIPYRCKNDSIILWNPSSSFVLVTVLLIPSVNAICNSLLNFCCKLIIGLLFLKYF